MNSEKKSVPASIVVVLTVVMVALAGPSCDSTSSFKPSEPEVSPSPPSPSPPQPSASVAPSAAVEPSAAIEPAIEPAARTTKSDWPLWGGSPERNMVNTIEKNVPHDFNVDPDKGPLKYVKWTAKLGSQTYGNPVVSAGKILVGTNNQLVRNPAIKGDKGVIMCFEEGTGKFLWQAVHDKLVSGRVNDWPEQGICSTPVIEGNRFWYVSNQAQLVCADLDGFLDDENDGPYKDEKYKSKIDADFIWVLPMMDDLAVFPHNLATSSPVIGGNLVFLVTSNGVDEGHVDIPSVDAPSFIAVDKNTGELVWEDDSPGEGILHGQWGSPSYGELGGQKQVLFPGGDGWLYAFEPTTGKPLWKFDLNPKDAKWILGGRGTRNSIIATPVIHEDRVFLAVGQDPEHGEGPGHLYCINPVGKTGDITSSGAVWHFGDKDFHRTLSTVAVADGLVYAVDLSGFLNCLDVKTGKPHWVYDTLAAVWGSPMVVDGKVFLGDEDGDLVILKHGKESSEPLAEHNMGTSVYSTVTVANGVMYISTRTTLYAIQKP